MKIEFWMTGKSSTELIRLEVEKYRKKIRHYIPFEVVELIPPKPKSPELSVKTESDFALSRLSKEDYVILLDDKGLQLDSVEFAGWLERLFSGINNRIIFIAGGAYGFSEALYKRSNTKLSLSKMTFTHDLVRIVFTEQFYRALTIMNNGSYQH